MAGTKKARAVEFEGVEHTDSRLEKMTTAAIAQLVMRMRGATEPPKPATKAKAIDLVWRAAKNLPQVPETVKVAVTVEIPEAPGVREPERSPLEATAETQGTEKEPSAKVRKGKTYSVRIDGAERAAKVAAMTPQARGLAEAMRAAGRPLRMAECAGLLDSERSKNPSKVVAWYFAKIFRPAGILDEGRGSGAGL
ncbi:MAG: hypothetical protein LAP87_15350 [Acidobacteriia bacterium]|nr:hypothetical protein [Terriglobia bacterium]